ncbi:hypothetical protein BZA05DRAFT_251476 [Tricharina praecox]|uniref:uncharacterized protein n=1 Tax=Tricharina praecox TaxID=43433 RepID=UPI00221EBF28|nr:uncharacterized protein BZA05DRAFT_251476 [Tricharina praecox]KAI5854834.1 hypothetical protein BZA05DRAFT_251476 [Tricharina praecox]
MISIFLLHAVCCVLFVVSVVGAGLFFFLFAFFFFLPVSFFLVMVDFLISLSTFFFLLLFFYVLEAQQSFFSFFSFPISQERHSFLVCNPEWLSFCFLPSEART